MDNSAIKTNISSKEEIPRLKRKIAPVKVSKKVRYTNQKEGFAKDVS